MIVDKEQERRLVRLGQAGRVDLTKVGERGVAILGAMGRIVAIASALAFLLSVVGGCATASPDPSPVPRVTIQNDSGKPVDIVGFSHRSGTSTKLTTLADGGTFDSEPAGAQCDDDYSYFVETAGRRVATLTRPGCIGGTLVIAPQMLLTPDLGTNPEPS